MGLASGGTAGGQPDRYLLTGRPWRDNVPRQKAFEAKNPDVQISCDEHGGRWSASGRLAGGREVSARSWDLGELLDRLGAP